ncbi:MAG: hypothetical protein KJ571_14260 [Bacteroidetes bacterium]|nr:hypothetical protein [Bacteroidota bacterium]
MHNGVNENIISLNEWKFALDSDYNSENKTNKVSKGKWYKAFVPGTVHTDLLQNNLIDDPFYSDNELKYEWIAECNWIYKTEFRLNDSKKYNLVINGLDTFADIFLNNKKIYSCNNMFLSYKIDIEKHLIKGKNELKIYFFSPVNYAVMEEKKFGKLPVALNSSRVYARKAQYSYGWDWGPSFPTSGIWKNIFLEVKREAEIENVLFTTKSISEKKAQVRITFSIKYLHLNSSRLIVKLKNSIQHFEKEIKIKNSGTYSCDLEILDPKLWWPNGEGEQNLYDLSLSIFDDHNNILDCVEKKTGFRIIELIQKENNNNTFKLNVNGKDIYAKGVNWIPADSFLPRVNKAKYSKLLNLAKEANMNIVRVWGGGIYENDEFYNLCDELGLLVWQDFMFACGAYPENAEFLNNVEEEVLQNVNRLQHHPSIALWCGNNENEWIWYQEQKLSYKKMPGYKIYHNLIPALLKKIDPSIIYWPSSPFSYEEDPNSFNAGNTHQWDIWSRWIDYEDVKNDRSLFVTEFGFQGPANKDTYELCIPKDNRKINDRIFEFHNKQVEGPERIMKFLSAHLPVNTAWNDYLYLAQLNQGFALKTCLEYWRTNGRTNGSIIWQINDCWPVASWALIDSGLKPKIAYHFVKNIFAQQIVYFSSKENSIELYAQNQGQVTIKAQLKVFIINAAAGKIVSKLIKNIILDKNSSQILKSFPNSKTINDGTVIIAEIYNNSGELINSNYYNKLRWKHYKISPAHISIKLIEGNDQKSLSVSSDKPSYFVDLYAEGVEFSKRGFTILPGYEIIVDYETSNKKKLKASDIKIYSLNNYLI